MFTANNSLNIYIEPFKFTPQNILNLYTQFSSFKLLVFIVQGHNFQQILIKAIFIFSSFRTMDIFILFPLMTTLVYAPLLNLTSIFVCLIDNCSTFTRIFLTLFESNFFTLLDYHGFIAY